MARNVRASFLNFANKEKGILTIIYGVYRMLFSNIYLLDLSEDQKLCIVYFFCKIEGFLKKAEWKDPNTNVLLYKSSVEVYVLAVKIPCISSMWKKTYFVKS